MPLLEHWFTRSHSPAPASEPGGRHAPATSAPAEPDVPPKGSAWFESSHDLMRGLLVVEEPAGWRLVPRRQGAPRG